MSGALSGVPEEMVRAGAEVRLRQYSSEYEASHLTWKDFADEVREVLEAALKGRLCESVVEAEPFTGEPGELRCIKWAEHRHTHRSKEGATW